MDCPKCGGPMWDNRESKKNPKQPDFKCKDKDNCDGVIWPPRGNNRSSTASRPASAPQRNSSDDRSSRIERQHSQEMALRYAALKNMVDINTTALRELIDWFQRDVGHVPSASTRPEPEIQTSKPDDDPDHDE